MGNIFKGGALGFLGSLLGGAPKVSNASKAALKEERDNAGDSRSALNATAGGIAGEELGAGGVKQRNTLLGN